MNNSKENVTPDIHSEDGDGWLCDWSEAAKKDNLVNTSVKKITFYCPRGCNTIKLPAHSLERCGSCGEIMSPERIDDYDEFLKQMENAAIAKWENREHSC